MSSGLTDVAKEILVVLMNAWSFPSNGLESGKTPLDHVQVQTFLCRSFDFCFTRTAASGLDIQNVWLQPVKFAFSLSNGALPLCLSMAL